MNRPHRFKQADVARAVRGATAGGLKVHRVEIDADGRIVLVSSDPQRPERTSPQSAYEAWRAKRDAHES